MKRFYKLFGIAAIAAVIAIGLAGCATDNNGDSKTIAITLAKLSATSFSITLDNAEWKPSDIGPAYVNVFLDVLDFSDCTVGSSSLDAQNFFEAALSSDKKTVTATLSNYGAVVGTPSGTIKFISNPDLGQFAGQFTGELVPEAGGDTTYVGKPAEGITFP
jgi:hypothetical protein